MNKDEYGEVINGQGTYEKVAQILKKLGVILIGWTDESGTHFDILFVHTTNFEGSNIQGGIRRVDLFVSIMRMGAFGFDVENTDTDWNYYDEKLSGGTIGETTGRKLAELINGIKKELLK